MVPVKIKRPGIVAACSLLLFCLSSCINNEENPPTGWQVQRSSVFGAYQGVYFVTPSKGFVVGYSPWIYRTKNGGKTWDSTLADATENSSLQLFSLFFLNETVGYAAGLHGFILKTVDGGDHWTRQSSGTSKQITSIRFLNENCRFRQKWLWTDHQIQGPFRQKAIPFGME